jgi:hypothetical protein
MNYTRTLRVLASRQADKDSAALPKAHTTRSRSTNELNAEYHQPGYGLHFCFHGRTYYEPCKTCRRSSKDAALNLSRLK